MTDRTFDTAERRPAGIGFFEKYLTFWVAICIFAGIALGHSLPGGFRAIAAAEVAKVNIPVAALIWLMIVPMLLRVDFASLAGAADAGRRVEPMRPRADLLMATGMSTYAP